MDKKIINIENKIIIKDIKKAEKLYSGYNGNEALEYYLNQLTKDELVKIGSKNNKRGLTNLKKSDVVTKINDVILDNTNYLLSQLDIEAYNYITEIINSKGIKDIKKDESDIIEYLRIRGVLYLALNDNEAYAISPKNVLDKIESEIKIDFKKKSKLNTEIIQVAAGLCYTFGVFKIEDISKVINKYFDEKLSYSEIVDLLNIGAELGYEYIINKEYIYHTYIQDLKTTIKAIEDNKDAREIRMDKSSLLRIGKKNYFEDNKEFKNLEKLLSYLFGIEKYILNEELEFINVAIKNDMEVEYVCEEFLASYEIKDELERAFIKDEVKKAALSVGKWSLKGNTLKEIEGKSKTIVVEEKVGRNDPCICGSNKKYKKCCGK